jgi:hypothetical protein
MTIYFYLFISPADTLPNFLTTTEQASLAAGKYTGKATGLNCWRIASCPDRDGFVAFLCLLKHLDGGCDSLHIAISSTYHYIPFLLTD